jgi:hypothetical protein
LTETDFIAIATPVITIIIGVTTLGGFMYKIGSWINTKAEAKATALKLVTDKSAADLKLATETTAKDLKLYTDDTAKQLREYTDKTLSAVTDRIAKIDDKVMAMLQDLANRSDLVNGNVAHIRSDLMDLQDQVTELAAEVDRGNGEESEDTILARKKVYVERRKKRQQIEYDRDNQEHPLYGKGRQTGSTRREERK